MTQEVNKFANLDVFETTLVHFLEPQKRVSKNKKPKKVKLKAKTRVLQFVEAAAFSGQPPRYPGECYVGDPSDSDRVYAAENELLISSFPEQMRGGLEACVTNETGNFLWVRYEVCSKPKGHVPATVPFAWVAKHQREYDDRGEVSYSVQVFPVTKNGKIIPSKIANYGFDPASVKKAQSALNLVRSIAEDARRPGVLLASLTAGGAELKFPVNYGFHAEMLKLRDGPANTPTGRKNPILTLVSRHLRAVKTKAPTPVKSHWRGAEVVQINGLTLTLEKFDLGE